MKVAGYCRVSTDIQIDRDSINVQVASIIEYCQKAELELMYILKDEGVSGSVPIDDRPFGQKLNPLLNSKEIQGVVFTKLDRAFRNAGQALVTLDSWNKAGHSVFILNFMGGNRLDTRDPSSKAMLGMMSVFAQFERDMIALRVKEQMQSRKSNGQVYCRAIYGYNNIEGNLVPNKEEQLAIRLMRTLRDAGYTLRGIATALTEEGIPTPRGAKQWYASSIADILQNDIHYKGKMFHLNDTYK